VREFGKEDESTARVVSGSNERCMRMNKRVGHRSRNKKDYFPARRAVDLHQPVSQPGQRSRVHRTRGEEKRGCGGNGECCPNQRSANTIFTKPKTYDSHSFMERRGEEK